MKVNYNKILNIIEYIFAFFLILECRSIFMHKMNVDYRINEILCIILFTLITMVLIQKKRKYTKLALFFTYILMFTVYIGVFLICSVSRNNYISFLLKFFYGFIGMLFYYIIRGDYDAPKQFLRKLSNVMIALAILSLLLYLLGPMFNIIKPTGKIKIMWGIEIEIKSYYNLHYVAQNIEIAGRNIPRNTGIFTEAPMYSLNLTIALLVELFLRDKVNFKKIVILCITIITTLSTTGIIIMMMMIVGKYIITEFKSRLHTIIKKVALPLLCVIACIAAFMLLKTKVQSNSFLIRLDDYQAGYLSWKDSPIMGNGYGNTEALDQYKSAFRAYNTGQSNSILKILSEGGIYFLLFYFVPWIGCIIYALKNREKNIVIIAISMFVLFFVTIFPYNFIIINLIAIAWYYMFKGSKRKKLSRSIKIENETK